MSSKPPINLRLPHQRYIMRSGYISLAVATVCALAWKFGVYDARKKHYEEFYRTYDQERHAQRMLAAGLFDCGPEWEQKDKSKDIKDYAKEIDKAISASKKK